MRTLLRNPGFSTLVILTMALGIGANTVMFGVIEAVFLRPLPFPNQDRIVTLWESDAQSGIAQRKVTPANFVDWEAQASSFEDVGVLPNWTGPSWQFNVVSGDHIERVPGIYASSGFFRVLGVRPALGQTFGREEDRQAGLRKAVVSDSYWRRDRSVLGKTIEIDTFRGGKFTVIGVMPPGFDFPSGSQLWLSLGDWGAGPMPTVDAARRCCSWYTVFGRLKPGVTVDQAASEMSLIGRRIADKHPTEARVTGVKVTPLRETLVGSQRLLLFALFGAVSCVLLIACANVANLLLSRSISRRREIQTRMALGASRWRIARQLMGESLLLSGAGAVLGVAVAAWTMGPLVSAVTEYVPMIESARLDWAVLGFAALLALATGAICGLAPLVQLPVGDWGSRGQSEGLAGARLRRVLVVGEVAVAVMLVVTAGLFIRTLTNLRSVDLGFETGGKLTVDLDLSTGPMRGANSPRFIAELLPQLAALPGVQSVAAATQLPLDARPEAQAITREDRAMLPAAQSPQVVMSAVTPGYFDLMYVALRRGRLFTEGDTAESNLVAVINETAAKRYWPGEDPVGKRFAIGSRERFGRFRRPTAPDEVEWREIVGVVASIRSEGFASEPQPEVFYSYRQFPLYDPKLIVRTQGPPLSLARAVRDRIASVNKNAVITRFRTMDDIAGASIVRPRFQAALLALFSLFAVALGMLGIYGVISYSVAQRTRELGIQMALGAQAPHMARMIVGQALRLTAMGASLGLLGSFAAARWISSLLFGVEPADPFTMAAGCLVLFAAALLSSYIPARRVFRIDPVIALRSE